jgi:ATP-dependent protease HslVU (ClpYQ) ATPase subunit
MNILLKTKNIIAMLVDSEYAKIDKQFQKLNPVYNFDLTFLEKGISKFAENF